MANLATINDINENDYQSAEEIHNFCLSTRIYSDCWSAYRFNDFKEFGYYLHKVKHSVFFGSGLFHKNIIEGLWDSIKRFSYDFEGLNFLNLANLQSKGINIVDYLNDWTCSSLFFLNSERKKK